MSITLHGVYTVSPNSGEEGVYQATGMMTVAYFLLESFREMFVTDDGEWVPSRPGNQCSLVPLHVADLDYPFLSLGSQRPR